MRRCIVPVRLHPSQYNSSLIEETEMRTVNDANFTSKREQLLTSVQEN